MKRKKIPAFYNEEKDLLKYMVQTYKTWIENKSMDSVMPKKKKMCSQIPIKYFALYVYHKTRMFNFNNFVFYQVILFNIVYSISTLCYSYIMKF